MKKYISILMCAILAAACSMFDGVLDAPTQSSYADNIVFSNYTTAEYNIFSISEVCGHTDSYRGRLHLFYGTNTDLEFYNAFSYAQTDGAKADDRIRMAEYNDYIANGQNNKATNAYNEIVAGIERANLCISGLRQYGNVGSDKDMAYLLGEALTYRAFFYFDLIRIWGEVPLRTEPVGEETTYIGKSDRDAIYKVILADLEEAMNYLYWPGEAKQTQRMDRMNKAFAKGLYARVALSAAGWAWRPDEGQVNTGNLGSLRLTTDPELSASVLYPKALKHLEDLIEQKCCSLEPSFESLWRKFNNSEHLSGVPEVLWVIPFSDGRGRWNYTHAYTHEAGTPYILNGAGRSSGTRANPTLWWKYDPKDPRRDITIVNMYYQNSDGVTGFSLRSNVSQWNWGKYRYEWMTSNPYGGGNDDGIKPIVMRYADVLLMAAELAAYQNKLDDAKAYLKEVRERACPGENYTKYTKVDNLTLGSAKNDGSGMIEDHNDPSTILGAIFAERALELAGEFVRKQDLIRWGLLKIALDEAQEDIKALANMTGAYAAYDAAATDKTEDDLLYVEETKEYVTVPYNFRSYSVYWRPDNDNQRIEVFGLEADQIGQVPADYSSTNPNGWIVKEYINNRAFRSNDDVAKKTPGTHLFWYDMLYRNEFGDPYPRSVWPMYASTLSAMQGALVNDYGY